VKPVHPRSPARHGLSRGRADGQRGVALLVALVMLVIIGLASVSVMRGALSSDLVANNTRVQTLAHQAAQIGLAYCERLLDDSSPADGSDMAKLQQTADRQPAFFNNLANWTDANVHKVPEGWMASEDSSFTPEAEPECMVEQLQDVPISGDKDFVVTARGFSPDYSADDDGNAESGSVVWLQSRLLYE
jgi:type IV pilus assembly protein PilX